jgi:rhodanese-related sulfurtransferase
VNSLSRVASTLGRVACAGVLSLAFGAALPAMAQDTPTKLDKVTVVTAAEVQKMMAAGVPVIDTRVANEYADSHIKGAKSVPYKEKSAKSEKFDASLDSFDLAKASPDKNAPVIFYCNAGECWKSYKASVMAVKAGYTKVNWFRGGIPEWKSKGLPVE